MEEVRPDSTKPIAAEAPRGCEGSLLAREGLPLALRKGGHGDPMVYVRLRVFAATSHYRFPWGRTASFQASFPICKWTSLGSTAPGAREVGGEMMWAMKRVCPETGPPGKGSTMSGCSAYNQGRGGWIREEEAHGETLQGLLAES